MVAVGGGGGGSTMTRRSKGVNISKGQWKAPGFRCSTQLSRTQASSVIKALHKHVPFAPVTDSVLHNHITIRTRCRCSRLLHHPLL